MPLLYYNWAPILLQVGPYSTQIIRISMLTLYKPTIQIYSSAMRCSLFEIFVYILRTMLKQCSLNLRLLSLTHHSSLSFKIKM